MMRRGLVAVGFLFWGICLCTGVPSLLRGWFFLFHIQPLSVSWMTVWGLSCGGLLWSIPKIKADKQVLLLFLGAWLLPIFLSLAGTQSLLDHCVQSGHSEFVITGSRGWNIHDVMRDYEQMVLSPSQRYAASKPPGQVVMYFLFNMLAPSGAGEVPGEFVDGAHWNLSLLLTVLMPLLSGLVVFPMFSLSQKIGVQYPWVPVLLFVVSAPFSLIVMHVDQPLYPMLTMLCMVVLYDGMEQQKIGKLVLSGVIFGFGCFISFSLLPVILLAGLVVPVRKESIYSLLYVFFGFVLVYLVLYLGWSYNPILRYQNAMIHHAQWKGFPWTWGNWWIATRVNIVEFALWMGPLIPLFCSQKKKIKDTLLFFLLFLGLLLFGKAAGEVARLWLFLMPVYWIWVCKDGNNCRWEYAALMMLWTGLMKWQMDF